MNVAGLTPEEATRVLVAGHFAAKIRRRRAAACRVARLTVLVAVLVEAVYVAVFGLGLLTAIMSACLAVCVAAALVVRLVYVSVDVARYGYEWALFCLRGDGYRLGDSWDPPHGGWHYVHSLDDRASRVRTAFRRDYGAGLGLPGCEPIDDPAWYALRELDP